MLCKRKGVSRCRLWLRDTPYRVTLAVRDGLSYHIFSAIDDIKPAVQLT